MKFLSSPTFSLACAIFNTGFALQSFANGHTTWAIVGVIFAAFCFNNYIRARGDYD